MDCSPPSHTCLPFSPHMTVSHGHLQCCLCCLPVPVATYVASRSPKLPHRAAGPPPPPSASHPLRAAASLALTAIAPPAPAPLAQQACGEQQRHRRHSFAGAARAGRRFGRLANSCGAGPVQARGRAPPGTLQPTTPHAPWRTSRLSLRACPSTASPTHLRLLTTNALQLRSPSPGSLVEGGWWQRNHTAKGRDAPHPPSRARLARASHPPHLRTPAACLRKHSTLLAHTRSGTGIRAAAERRRLDGHAASSFMASQNHHLGVDPYRTTSTLRNACLRSCLHSLPTTIPPSGCWTILTQFITVYDGRRLDYRADTAPVPRDGCASGEEGRGRLAPHLSNSTHTGLLRDAKEGH